MLIDFLQLCRPVLQCESGDFAQCLIDIQQQEISLGFMPAMTDDLYPFLFFHAQVRDRSFHQMSILFPLALMTVGQNRTLSKSSTRFTKRTNSASNLLSNLMKCYCSTILR